ncbi:hypothetical protein AT241_05960 [Bartonella henselae]|nr:hypothetical protein AT241_05960 [Bartonella henselae]OLL53436.1 hypothetical protein AT240_03110 [Bartonella henselae]
MKSHNHKSCLQEMHGYLNETGEHLKEMHKDAKETEGCLKGAYNLLEKRHEERDHVEPHYGENFSLLKHCIKRV